MAEANTQQTVGRLYDKKGGRAKSAAEEVEVERVEKRLVYESRDEGLVPSEPLQDSVKQESECDSQLDSQVPRLKWKAEIRRFFGKRSAEELNDNDDNDNEFEERIRTGTDMTRKMWGFEGRAGVLIKATGSSRESLQGTDEQSEQLVVDMDHCAVQYRIFVR
ncbi:hypothetical protein BCV70DRAFT_231743 [Testicularia cyperi]|uniref:Uncharacterized protein n=1 Tax=Testicularia cyperi TaxID=1882483 RepID=A0A317XS06_9BASI|nr:hypothetical protein BCV70DRAFT_231743 [Testicularia cyperi]